MSVLHFCGIKSLYFVQFFVKIFSLFFFESVQAGAGAKNGVWVREPHTPKMFAMCVRCQKSAHTNSLNTSILLEKYSGAYKTILRLIDVAHRTTHVN